MTQTQRQIRSGREWPHKPPPRTQVPAYPAVRKGLEGIGIDW